MTPASSFSAIIPTVYAVDAKNKINDHFVMKYKNRYKGQPTDLSAFSYDAIFLYDKMLSRCGNETLKSDLKKCVGMALPFNSTTGKIVRADGSHMIRHINIK